MNRNSVDVVNDTVEVIKDDLVVLRDMSIEDIDTYGANIQEAMVTSSNELLSKVNMIDLGDTRESLDKLNLVAKKQKDLLPVLRTPLKRIRGIQDKFTKVQSRIEEIGDSLNKQQEKLTEHVDYMLQQTKNLDNILVNLRECEDNLNLYINSLNEGDDKLRYQAVANRLRVINSTRIIAEQAQAEAMMIVCEQREAKLQLEQVIRNALPAIQIQAVNSIGIRVNKETQNIIKRTREITGEILIQNAKDVKDMAIELQKNKTKSIVDESKLKEAQDILDEALMTVKNAAIVEADTNIDIIKELTEKAKSNRKYIESLSAHLGETSN